jgi:hypothetical protein
MPYRVERFEATPNPNAVKCVLDRSPTATPRSYFNAASAQGDPLAESLFAVTGVTNVLIHDGWVSVCKASDADWKTLKTALQQVFADAE